MPTAVLRKICILERRRRQYARKHICQEKQYTSTSAAPPYDSEYDQLTIVSKGARAPSDYQRTRTSAHARGERKRDGGMTDKRARGARAALFLADNARDAAISDFRFKKAS